jgi:hypothetical protein
MKSLIRIEKIISHEIYSTPLSSEHSKAYEADSDDFLRKCNDAGDTFGLNGLGWDCIKEKDHRVYVTYEVEENDNMGELK